MIENNQTTTEAIQKMVAATVEPVVAPVDAPFPTETIQHMIAPQEDAKPYTFRKLSSPDVFPMFQIISKIGVNEFTACFEKDAIKSMLASLTGENKEENTDEVDMSSIVGISVALEIANVIFGNLPKCEEHIYQLLSQTSNLSVDEIKALDMVVFTEMVIDFIKKDEFKDFIKVVSRLFK